MSYDPSQVAFVDTETTGLDPAWHEVWEIAVIVDGVEHVWQQRIKTTGAPFVNWTPDHLGPVTATVDIAWSRVDPWVLENTGIRERYEWETALTPLDSAIRFATLLRGRHVAGACPWFDSERLHRIILRLEHNMDRELPWHYHLIDVETLIVGYLAGVERGFGDPDLNEPLRLDDIHQSLPWDSRELSRLVGVNPDDFKPKHSALADARWAKACFEAVMGGPA